MSDNKILWALQSRKFWASCIGLVLILVTAWGQDPFPTDAVVTAILGIVAAYVAATAYEDGKRHEAAGNVAAANVTQPTSPAVGIDANTVELNASSDSLEAR